MNILLDTNVLLRLDHVGHPQQTLAHEAIETLVDYPHTLRTIPQILYEYWVVATRPTSTNGLGFDSNQAEQMLADHKQLFPPLLDERGILVRWEVLVAQHQVIGKGAHDARIAAAMLRHGLTHVMTFNHSDFARYPEITAFTPEQLLAGVVSLGRQTPPQ